jgi:methionyl aminopeptidase
MNEKYKQDFLQAGSLARQVRAYGKSLIKKGASYNDVITKINQKITDLGARAAFPPQIALNDVAAHFLPQPEDDIIFSDEVVKLDIGVCFNGAIGDCAVTVDLSGKHQALVDAVEDALISAEKSIKVGQPVREIGKIIEERITSYGFSPVRNLAGHGLGYYKIHMPPLIPNYADTSTAIVKAGMTFAIEPFATTGKGLIYDAGKPTIFSLVRARSVPLSVPRTLIAKIKNFNGLPFAMHDLMGADLPLAEIKSSIHELLKAGVIEGYAPLVEEAHGMVAQAENSVLVDKQGKVIITTR